MPVRGTCIEKGEPVTRTAYLCTMTTQKAWEIFDKIRGIKNFTGIEPEEFKVTDLHWLFEPNVIVMEVDDVGVVVARWIREANLADVHITFWDKRLRGREELCRQIADFLISLLGLQGVITAIPAQPSAIRAFARRMGFEVRGERNGQELYVYPSTCNVQLDNHIRRL